MQFNVQQALVYTAQVDMGQDTEPSPIIDDFGFNHDYSDVLGCWYALRNWHILPVAGGWLDQPLAWRQDLQTMQSVYNEQADILQNKISVIPTEPVHDETGAEIRLGIFDGP